MNIFKWITGNIIKWWQLTIRPILRIDNNGDGRKQTIVSEEIPVNGQEFVKDSHKVQDLQGSVPVFEGKENLQKTNPEQERIHDAVDATSVMDRIQKEQEEKRRKTMEKAQEDARLEAILNSTRVDVSAYIKAGREAMEQQKKEDEVVKEETLDSVDEDVRMRAEEIIARLNREAEEDARKKQDEIEAAKRQAATKFEQ